MHTYIHKWLMCLKFIHSTKIICKVRKRRHQNSLLVFFSHTGFQQGMKLSTNYCSYVYCNYKCSQAWLYLTLSLSISYPYLIKFHVFVDKQPRGDAAWNEACNSGCNSGPTGHDFCDNSSVWVFVVTYNWVMDFHFWYLQWARPCAICTMMKQV
jgi:hypothetical protein